MEGDSRRKRPFLESLSGKRQRGGGREGADELEMTGGVREVDRRVSGTIFDLMISLHISLGNSSPFH